MGEGFGDFLAAYIYLQDGNPTYQAARRFCVVEWDAVSYNAFSGPDDGSGCLRWVDGTDENNGADIGTYGGTPVEEHDDGRYWSATLTCVFNGIEPSARHGAGPQRMLTLVLAHHFDLAPTAAQHRVRRLARRAARGGRRDLRWRGDRAHQHLRPAAARQDGAGRHHAAGGRRRARASRPGRRQRLVPDRADGEPGTISEPESQAVDNGCDDGADAGRHARHDDHLHGRRAPAAPRRSR